MAFTTISQMFNDITTRFDKKPLYYYKRESKWIGLTGQEIKYTVKDISFGLLSFGVTKGDRVSILANNSPKWAMCDYGSIISGAATVSIYPTLIASQILYILFDSGTKVIFVENNEQLEKILEIKDQCPELRQIIVLDNSYNGKEKSVMNFTNFLNLGTSFANESELSFETDLVSSSKPDDLLTLIYTSGTTGNPKGVMLSHKNLMSNVDATINSVKFTEDETFLSFLPLSHVFERMGGHFSAFSVGASVYYAENIETVPENLVEVKPTIVLSVPRLYEKIHAKIVEGLKTAPNIKQKLFAWATKVGRDVSTLNLAGETIPFGLKMQYNLADKIIYSKISAKVGGRLRFFVSGGAPLSQEIAEFFASVGITILEGYGLTETSPVLTCNTEVDKRFGSVGKPLYNIDVKIANDGEILAKGPSIMLGYFNNKEATNEVIDKDGWFYTGDIGEIDQDGYLKITDRKKSIIVTSGGKNIAPAPLENAVVASPYVEQIVAIGDKRNFICAIIAPNFENVIAYLKEIGKDVTSHEAIVEHVDVKELFTTIIEEAMSKFSQYEKIKKFILISRLLTLEKGELTPTLKVVRKVVEENFKEDIDSIYQGDNKDSDNI